MQAVTFKDTVRDVPCLLLPLSQDSDIQEQLGHVRASSWPSSEPTTPQPGFFNPSSSLCEAPNLPTRGSISSLSPVGSHKVSCKREFALGPEAVPSQDATEHRLRSLSMSSAGETRRSRPLSPEHSHGTGGWKGLVRAGGTPEKGGALLQVCRQHNSATPRTPPC